MVVCWLQVLDDLVVEWAVVKVLVWSFGFSVPGVGLLSWPVVAAFREGNDGVPKT